MDYKTWARTLSELNARHGALLGKQHALQAKRLSSVRSRTLLYRLNEVFRHADLADAVFQDLIQMLQAHIRDVLAIQGNIQTGRAGTEIANEDGSLQGQLESLRSTNVVLLTNSLENLLDVLAVTDLAALTKILEIIAGQLPGYGTWIGACSAIKELLAILQSDLEEADRQLFELECFEFAVFNASVLAVFHVSHFLGPIPSDTLENLSLQEAVEKVRGDAINKVQSRLAVIRAKSAVAIET